MRFRKASRGRQPTWPLPTSAEGAGLWRVRLPRRPRGLRRLPRSRLALFLALLFIPSLSDSLSHSISCSISLSLRLICLSPSSQEDGIH